MSLIYVNTDLHDRRKHFLQVSNTSSVHWIFYVFVGLLTTDICDRKKVRVRVQS